MKCLCRFVRLQAQPDTRPIEVHLTESLLVLLVHCRDVTKMLLASKTQSPEEFAWAKQLRYYLHEDEQTECFVEQLNVR